MLRSIGLAVFLAPLAFPAQQASAQLKEKEILTLAASQKMISAAQAEAERIISLGSWLFAIDGGWPILIPRMDSSAFIASVELALDQPFR